MCVQVIDVLCAGLMCCVVCRHELPGCSAPLNDDGVSCYLASFLKISDLHLLHGFEFFFFFFKIFIFECFFFVVSMHCISFICLLVLLPDKRQLKHTLPGLMLADLPDSASKVKLCLCILADVSQIILLKSKRKISCIEILEARFLNIKDFKYLAAL